MPDVLARPHEKVQGRGLLRNFALMCTAVFGGILLGCTQKQGGTAEASAETIEVPQHSARKGLLLPEVTRKSLDLKTVEVTEQKVNATLDFQVRVYKVSGTNAFASGTMTPEEAKPLKVGQWIEARRTDGSTTTAAISGINDKLEKAAGFVEVIIEMPHALSGAAVGEFLRATVTLSSAGNVATVPREALLECSDGPFVYAANGDAFVRTPVKIGASNDQVVEITDGLYSGDLVALRPVMSLWLMELAAIKGGQACCVEPPRGK